MIENIENVRSEVRELESDKRFSHTLGVEEEAYNLGKIFIPEKAEKLALAGLLHDITKCYKTDKQIELLNEYGIKCENPYEVPKLLHSKTGCEFARRKFGKNIVDDEIYSAILYHTTGKPNMTIFETIIYLADYIEKTRTFEDCIVLRKYFYDNIEKTSTYEEKLEVLRKTMIMSFDMTIKNLIEEEKPIDYDTITARNYFLLCEKCFQS